MTTQFGDQGGAASSEPSWLRRRLTSLLMRRLADPARRERARRGAEAARRRAGEPHRVHYFHQPEDPYSHLAAQLLAPLCARYEIVLVPQLVAGEEGANTPEPALLADYARRDAAAVAPEYGLRFPVGATRPDAALLARVRAILAAQDDARFAAAAVAAGDALWCGDAAALARLESAAGAADESTVAARLAEGNALRRRLGHYSGAMFHYGGEWYWGVDRLYHLENRLRALGASREPAAPLLAPRPAVEARAGEGADALTLEFYASLRSPYTSIVYDHALALAARTGVSLALRPVLPMVMRGVPVTVQKGRYIFFDTAREAEASGLRWGHAHDPIGEPVRRVYALLPWARAQGAAEQLLGAALHAAFFEAVDLGRGAGLRRVVEQCGLSWAEAAGHLRDRGWEQEFEQNRLALYDAGIWGVPAFRLLDAGGRELVSAWGQDRLWLVSRAIARATHGGHA